MRLGFRCETVIFYADNVTFGWHEITNTHIILILNLFSTRAKEAEHGRKKVFKPKLQSDSKDLKPQLFARKMIRILSHKISDLNTKDFYLSLCMRSNQFSCYTVNWPVLPVVSRLGVVIDCITVNVGRIEKIDSGCREI